MTFYQFLFSSRFRYMKKLILEVDSLYRVHEFVEIKENLIPEKESLTIASISHPSLSDNYVYIFGLTGTIGEINERNEIKEIYHLDSFHVPTNFESKKKISDKIIVDNKKQKYQKIISEIKKMKKDKYWSY